MSKLHFSLLNRGQLDALSILKNFAQYGILGGGTALMLQLAHRKSYDLDVFLPKSISKKFLYSVRRHFHKIDIVVDTGDEFTFISSPQEVKISFIYYPFPPMYKRIRTPYLDFFSWQDIGLDKA